MDKIKAFVASVPQDKLLHFILGVLLALSGLHWGWQIAVLCNVAGSLGKELFDKYVQKEQFDPLDFLATILGMVPVLLSASMGLG